MSVSGEDAVREFVVSRLTLVADNVTPLQRRLTSVAVSAVEGEVSHAWDRYEYLEALAGRREDGLRVLREAVGSDIADALSEWLEECRESADESTGAMLAILSELLDLGDRQQWVLLGHHYMPEVDDVFPEE